MTKDNVSGMKCMVTKYTVARRGRHNHTLTVCFSWVLQYQICAQCHGHWIHKAVLNHG